MNLRRPLLQAALALAVTPLGAWAQGTRPIRLIVPYPPGGPLDSVAKYGPVVKASGAQVD